MAILTDAQRKKLTQLLLIENGDLPSIDALMSVSGDGSGIMNYAERQKVQQYLRTLQGDPLALDALFGTSTVTGENAQLVLMRAALAGDGPSLDALLFGIPALREVGTRASLNLLQAANTAAFNCRKGDFIRNGSVTTMQVSWANFCVNAGTETASGGVLSVTASIEYPANANPATPGTRTQLLFSGSATGTVASGGVLTSDALPIAIPNGAFFRIWWRQVNTVGVCYSNIGPFQSVAALGDAQITSASDFTMSGTFTDDLNNNILWHSRCMGMTAGTNDVLVWGNSRSEGSGETVAGMDATGACGELARPLVPNHAMWRLGQAGSTLIAAAGSTPMQNQLIALSAPTTVLVEGGANDYNIGQTGAQVYANKITVVNKFPSSKKWNVTNIPRTTSTDSWATTVNQTVLGSEAQRLAGNVLDRANSGNFDRVIDYSPSVFEASPGIWNAPGYTGDGVHPLTAACKLISPF